MDNSSPRPGTTTRKPTPAEARRAAKNDRKRAGAEAARVAAAARKRRNAGLGAGLGVLAIVGIVVLIVALSGSPAKKVTAGASASPSTSAGPVPVAGPTAAASASSPASPAPFEPNVPKGESSKLKTMPVIKAGTGTVTAVKVTTLIQGTGAAIKSGDSIRADYVGATYKTGVVFDSSWKDGTDFTTAIGTGQVIKGWDQGLIGVKAGSRVQLDIPAALAYGATTTDGSPAGDLRFIIDVLTVTPAA